ncbi:MAG: helicase HerA-like domain-containing protein, partial [Vampirovibrionales bacterium]|nr:helicase HerA-like domain-containing protein [Vampirovibrionales bacterium]
MTHLTFAHDACAPNTPLNAALAMLNRHGLIAGATGTGKTVTLQTIAEQLSEAGVTVFLADVKGDLSGLAKPGEPKPAFEKRLAQLKVNHHAFKAYPTVFWDIAGEQGHP